jgi:hypothetical protein
MAETLYNLHFAGVGVFYTFQKLQLAVATKHTVRFRIIVFIMRKQYLVAVNIIAPREHEIMFLF